MCDFVITSQIKLTLRFLSSCFCSGQPDAIYIHRDSVRSMQDHAR